MVNVECGVLESIIVVIGIVIFFFEQQFNVFIVVQVESVYLCIGIQVECGDLIFQFDKLFIEFDVVVCCGQFDLCCNFVELFCLEFDCDLKELEYDDQIKGL